jgi:hypothetical protein
MLLYDSNVLSTAAALGEASNGSAEGLHVYRRAAAAWAEYGYPLEEAQALVGAARCSLALDLPAHELVLEARDIVTELGAAPLLAETDKLSEQLKAINDSDV